MPAIDQCHQQVVRALEKEGRVVAPKPYTLPVPASSYPLFVDIEAHQVSAGEDKAILLVEIRCFSDESAATTDLYIALGQYIVYRSLLRQNRVDAA
jgi:hypothetical protein